MRSAISGKNAKMRGTIHKRTQADMDSNRVCRYMAIIAMIGFPMALPNLCAAAPLRLEFLKQYCIDCHGPDDQNGDRRFDGLTSEINTPDDALLWQEVLDQLNQGAMPPEDEPQPDKTELLAVIDAITASMAEAAQRFKGTGAHTELRRLNSFEYTHTIGDLLRLNIASWNPAADFPPEVRADGFDNNGAAQVTSGMLLDHYLEASEEAIQRATAFGPKPASKSYAQKSPFYFEGKASRDLPKLFQADRYGLPPLAGSQLRKVSLARGERGGLITQASFLTASANGVDTSPVVRGVYVQEKILGYSPPPPPPDVPLIEPDASGATTIREQLAMHRANATCASCHQKIDPYGFALENFDAIGGWRENYSEDHEIDSSGNLPTGETFVGVTDFRNLLIDRHEQFTRSLTEKLLTYGLGRELQVGDRSDVDTIIHQVQKESLGLRDLIQLVIQSETFRTN